MKKLLTFFLMALLAFSVGWAATSTDELVATDFAATSTTYKDFSGVEKPSGAIYAGNTAKNGTYIQLRSSNNSGIVSTTSGGKVKSVTINFASITTEGRKIDIYGKNSAYTSSSDLYDSSNQGTLLGSISHNVSGATSTGTVTVSGDYQYVGIRSNSGAAYFTSVVIEWETGGSTVETCVTPTFSPAAGTYTEAQSVTISTTTSGASIYYTTDGSTPSSSNGTLYTGAINVSETMTIKAIAVKSGNNDSQVASATYIIETGGSESGSKIYRKVTRTDDLVVGQKYILVYEETPAFMGAISSNIGVSETGPTINNSQVDISTNSNITEWTLGGTAAGYYFGDGNGNYLNWTSGNSLTTSDNPTINNSKWTISSSDDGYVMNNVATTARKLQYNSSSPRFACYTSSQKPAVLYVQVSATPTLNISPASQTINDAAAAELTITGENVSGNINASLANNTDWYLNPTTFSNTGGTATLTYTGRALSASNTVTASASGATDVSATVNYIADLYIVTDNGVTGNWDFSSGTPMTNNNGVYTATFTATVPNTFILFARKLGSDVTWNTRYVFGPSSDGDWWLPADGNGNGTIDLNDDDPIKIQGAGIYTVTINANAGTFTITKQNINVTILPEDGTHFTGSSISGTITSDPAGTIEWSTDGTNWQSYTDGFTATVNSVGSSVTVYARSTYNGIVSDVVSATYTRDLAPAPAAPSFSIPGGAVAAGTQVTITAPEGCTLYVDGNQVTSPYTVTIDGATTISAYCVNSEGTSSEPVSYHFTIAAVCHAVVEFKDNESGDASAATSWSALYGTADDNYFEAGRDYLSDASSITRVYKGATGLKFGNSSNGGAITFDLSSNTEWKVTQVIVNAAQYGSVDSNTFTVTTSDGQTATTSGTSGNYALDFDGSTITSITFSSTARGYLKGFTITYDCAPEVEAPVITPATGTYYESQTVTISGAEGTTIHYTTDGSEPTIDSPVYSGPFTAEYVANGTTTINAIAVDGQGNISPMTTVVYTWGVPTVTITPTSRNTTASSVNVTLTGTPTGATIYYTTDGSTPSASNGTEYTGVFSVALDEIGDEVTVNAIAVYNGESSTVASATYTRVDKVIEVNTPFFSPLQNRTYYGDQTLQIGCSTPNADIYYIIEEYDFAGEPTKSSTYYEGQTINMLVGHTYYVKAIAYIGSYASEIAEGWYTIEAAPQTQYTYTNLKDFNDNCPTGVTATFANPVQVVYHSTYTNNGEFAEFCYLRDNTDYACVYFGKRDNSNKTIFKMGDWIDGSQIAGVTNIWDRNFHIQLGTQSHEVTSWPTTTLGWSEIIPEEMTNDVIVAGTAEGSNSWGHYVHLRNTALRNVQDYGENDPKHTGLINDGTADAYYYDKFYRWSAGTCTYNSGGNTYTDQIQCLGDYDQAFFDAKQNAGATFDVYGIVDYYSQYNPPFEICPIDFLWAYNPVMTPATTTSYEPVTVNITATHPEWAAEGVVIYYKTEDMEEWAVYTGPITVNSTTTIQAYAEIPAEKLDGTNYNDMVRSEVVSETYTIEGIVDPTISPASQVIEIVTGDESVTVTVTDHNEAGSGAVTTYTVNGVEYSLEAGQSVEIVVTETTTITAVSSIVSGENTLYSNEKSETYTFVEKNSVIYDLLTQAPVVGNVYVIVNKDAYMGMSTVQNANNRGSVGVMFTDNSKTRVYGNEKLAQFVLEQATAGRYYFKNINGDNTGYLVVTTNANANLNTGAEANTYAEAGVSVENGDGYPATITFNYDGTTRYLRYYANGRTFSTYSDGSLNEEVYLYGLQATPLAYIESSITPVEDINNITANDKQVIVSDELIGVWAVVNPAIGVNQLWAKDQGNASIDKTYKTDEQVDYVKDVWGFETKEEWDQSNWVVLDFSGTGQSAYDYESRKLKSMTVEGYYYDDLNYAIKLTHAPEVVNNNSVTGYPGWDGNYTENGGTYYYNHYTPSNFMKENLNEPYGDGAEAGPASAAAGTKVFFMNPKVQEVAQVWAVWKGNDRFDVLQTVGTSINGYDLSGAFNVLTWDYNRLDGQNYGSPLVEHPDALVIGEPYLFHVIINRNDRNYGHSRRAPGATPDGSFGIMPADLPSGHPDPTAVKEMTGNKVIESVHYYNIMGMESEKPFEGINIMVTRYTDGSTSTMKVMR